MVLVVVVHSCNPWSQGVRTKGSGVWVQSELYTENLPQKVMDQLMILFRFCLCVKHSVRTVENGRFEGILK